MEYDSTTSIHRGVRKRRHHTPPPSEQHIVKKRLLDHLQILSLNPNTENPLVEGTNSNVLKSTRSKSPFESPLFNKKIYDANKILNNQVDANRVVIHNIDQFLKENSDGFDEYMSSKKVDNFEDIDVDCLVIPNIEFLDTKNNVDSSNSSLQAIFYNMFKKRMNGADSGDSETYYQEYISKYWSLVKYYNPQQLVYDIYINWMNVHFENDNDLDMDIDQGELENISEFSEPENKWIKTTSNYGSYYETEVASSHSVDCFSNGLERSPAHRTNLEDDDCMMLD
ncbi:unnamed protein product [Ambrosiozyma monospora]|uniref:Unnamed protein product n=1 Tax=Ambrosiozyma monospora TaxID=43982 RepID=A0A9W6T8M3_AMBMO|nr:unnamed protein product [Ambrosiozyma monospora]